MEWPRLSRHSMEMRTMWTVDYRMKQKRNGVLYGIGNNCFDDVIPHQSSILVASFTLTNPANSKHCAIEEIGSRVGRNQTTVMWICDRWIQEGTTDRRGRSHPPQCTTSCEDRQIVRMAVTDRSVTSRTVAQHIESVTHHSVSSRTIRRRLQQSGLSARRQLLGLPLTQNHRRLRNQWCECE
ncbi:transposable element Tcb1 transposase [Trichonephila clavipes]|nr:transposable element Tcb1 transposase [Trichonephila clavipes]